MGVGGELFLSQTPGWPPLPPPSGGTICRAVGRCESSRPLSASMFNSPLGPANRLPKTWASPSRREALLACPGMEDGEENQLLGPRLLCFCSHWGAWHMVSSLSPPDSPAGKRPPSHVTH